MAILDLQNMEPLMEKKGDHGAPSGSRTSKGCNNTTVQSNVSLVICILNL